MNWRKSFSKRGARWKIDLSISGQYLSPFFTFQTLATLLYATFTDLQNIFSGYLIVVYYCLSCVVFVAVFKLFAKFVLWIGLYKAEREYEFAINPYAVDKACEKDKNYTIPFSVNNASLAIQSAKLLMMWGDKNYGLDSEVWKIEREKTLKYIEEVQKTRDNYDSLRASD